MYSPSDHSLHKSDLNVIFIHYHVHKLSISIFLFGMLYLADVERTKHSSERDHGRSRADDC